MPLFLLISYAVSIWMCVDARKRGARGWWIVVILVPLGEWVYFFVVKFADSESYEVHSGSGKALKCSDCEFCVSIYKNGTRCQIRDKAVFRTPTHIEYCDSHSPASREP